MSHDLEDENAAYEQIEEDDKIEWWRPTKKDGFNLTNKLMRTGCRPIKRRYLDCIRHDSEGFEECAVCYSIFKWI